MFEFVLPLHNPPEFYVVFLKDPFSEQFSSSSTVANSMQRLIEEHSLRPHHLYADDSQMYMAPVVSQCTRKGRHVLTMWPKGCVAPSVVVRDLGILLDADVSMKSHVHDAYSINWLLRAACGSWVPSAVLCRDPYYIYMVSLVLSRLDYGNATLVGIPQHLLRRL